MPNKKEPQTKRPKKEFSRIKQALDLARSQYIALSQQISEKDRYINKQAPKTLALEQQVANLTETIKILGWKVPRQPGPLFYKEEDESPAILPAILEADEDREIQGDEEEERRAAQVLVNKLAERETRLAPKQETLSTDREEREQYKQALHRSVLIPVIQKILKERHKIVSDLVNKESAKKVTLAPCLLISLGLICGSVYIGANASLLPQRSRIALAALMVYCGLLLLLDVIYKYGNRRENLRVKKHYDENQLTTNEGGNSISEVSKVLCLTSSAYLRQKFSSNSDNDAQDLKSLSIHSLEYKQDLPLLLTQDLDILDITYINDSEYHVRKQDQDNPDDIHIHRVPQTVPLLLAIATFYSGVTGFVACLVSTRLDSSSQEAAYSLAAGLISIALCVVFACTWLLHRHFIAAKEYPIIHKITEEYDTMQSFLTEYIDTNMSLDNTKSDSVDLPPGKEFAANGAETVGLREQPAPQAQTIASYDYEL